MRLSFRAVLLCISMRLLQARTLTVQYTFVNGDTLRASSEADWRVRYRGERGAGRRPDTRSRRDSGATKSSSTAMSIPLRLRASGAPRRQTASRALRGACGVPWKAVFAGVGLPGVVLLRGGLSLTTNPYMGPAAFFIH